MITFKRINYAVEVKNIRMRFKITQKDFARLIGVKAKTIYKFEHGEIDPSPKQWNDLKFLKSLSYFVVFFDWCKRRWKIIKTLIINPIWKSVREKVRKLFDRGDQIRLL